jgi:tetrapyrrole methylase family protein/MazG family protein
MTPNPNQPTPDLAPLQQTEAVWQAVGADRSQGYQALPASAVASRYYPAVELSLPLLITQLESATLPSVQRALLNAYPPTQELTLAQFAADGLIQTQRGALPALATWAIVTTPAWLYVPPLPTDHSFTGLQNIVAHLRSPAGCPWDRKQTLATMRHDLLGECAEVLEALDAHVAGQANDEHIAEELGDLLMAAALILQIATEAERFRLSDAMHSIVTKLIRRHPHVFGETVVTGVQEVLTNWDAIKRQEKAAKGLPLAHPLDGVPASLPALEKARQLQSKAHKAGLLPTVAPATVAEQIGQQVNAPLTAETLGALLWQLVSLARAHDLNPEDALRAYSVQFRATAAPA